MTYIVWKDEWNTYNKKIDEQHQHLIDIVNRLDNEEENLIELIKLIIEYASGHFIDEQSLMININYPEEEYILHKQEHNSFRHILLDFSFLFIYLVNDKEKFNTQRDIFKHYMAVWFSNHFLTLDKKFISWLNNKV